MKQKIKKITDVIKDYNREFIEKVMQNVITVSFATAAVITFVFSIFYFFDSSFSFITNALLVFTIMLGIIKKINSSNIKNKSFVISLMLYITNFLFISYIFIFCPHLGVYGIYNPGYNFIFMMFIIFSIFNYSFTMAVLNSFSYATIASVLFVLNFETFQTGLATFFLNTPISNLTIIAVPFLYYLTAIIISYYVWYRTKKYSDIKTYIQSAMITSAHKKLIFEGDGLFDNWCIIALIINIEKNIYGGDFISKKENDDSYEIMIGDVIDHGVDSSQIAFGIMSIFQSKTNRHPEETLLNCHLFLKKLGYKEGGMSYISIIKLYKNSNKIEYYGCTGVHPLLITPYETKEIKVKNLLFGLNINIEQIKPLIIELAKNEMFVVKTDGWNSKHDEKASVIIGYQDD